MINWYSELRTLMIMSFCTSAAMGLWAWMKPFHSWDVAIWAFVIGCVLAYITRK